MHITAICPHCETKYQLNPDTLGKRIPCPNASCREIFEVVEAPQSTDNGPPPEPAEKLPGNARGPDAKSRRSDPPPVQYESGSVGSLVPILPVDAAEPVMPIEVFDPSEVIESVEPVEMPQPAGPQEQQWWESAPPVRRGATKKMPAVPTTRKVERLKPPTAPLPEQPVTPAAPPEPVAETTEAIQPPEGKLREVPPGAWEQPPPVRRPAAEAPQPAPVPAAEEAAWPTTPSEPDLGYGTAPASRRWGPWIITLMLLLVAGAIGGGVYVLIIVLGANEGKLYAQATEAFDKGNYSEAHKKFADLLTKYPASERKREYEVMAALCEALAFLEGIDPKPEEAFDRLKRFLLDFENDPLLDKHRPLIKDKYKVIAETYLERADQALDQDPPDITTAGDNWQNADAVRNELKGLAPSAELRELENRLADVQKNLRIAQLVEETLKYLVSLDPTPESLEKARTYVKRSEVANHPKVLAALKQFEFNVVSRVTWKSVDGVIGRPPQSAPDPSMLVVPLLGDPDPDRPSGNGVFLALARGVLYALSEKTGDVLWHTRVGIDTATLPVRLPASDLNPEILLVLSSDTNTLTARDVRTGNPRWQHELQAPCLGRPLLVGPLAYVATYNGTIQVIEVVNGQLLGWYQLGQSLTVGGVFEEGRGLAYFPAESNYVYVIDITKRRDLRVLLLETGHAAGSLRGEPIIVGATALPPGADGRGDERPRYLILTQADGLAHMRLRAYPLPLATAGAAPPKPALTLPGYSWFSPYFDSEKVALVTDTGALGLFGVNQQFNHDLPLFRLTTEKGGGAEAPHPAQVARAQVVHGEESDFWVLVNGVLQRVQLVIHREKGLTHSEVWRQPPRLGSPLHAGQVNDNRDVLFAVTRALDRPAFLATAVHADTGRVLWQRQLGLDCQGDPLVLDGKIVTLDPGMGLSVFDPAAANPAKDPVLAPPRAGHAGTPPVLLRAPDEKTAYAVGCPSEGSQLLVRKYQAGKPVADLTFELAAPLGGTPALGPDCLVVPLADGSLARVPLNGEKNVPLGPTWRYPGASIPGHVVHLAGHDYVFTDGSSKLTPIRWAGGPQWDTLKEHTLETGRIISAPALLKADGEGTPRIVVADSGGNLTLLRADNLQHIRSWKLGGEVTAGPFVRGQQIGCVVKAQNRFRLVWIDPGKDGWLWTWTGSGEDEIVGQPQLVDDMLVVADNGGRVVALNPRTGEALGRAYTVPHASVAAAATPVAFGPDRLFVPLTDGTVLLLDRVQLKTPAQARK